MVADDLVMLQIIRLQYVLHSDGTDCYYPSS